MSDTLERLMKAWEQASAADPTGPTPRHVDDRSRSNKVAATARPCRGERALRRPWTPLQAVLIYIIAVLLVVCAVVASVKVSVAHDNPIDLTDLPQ